jgi:alkylhydroperoxidase family enzyme
MLAVAEPVLDAVVMTRDRHAEALAAVRDAVLRTPGDTTTRTREVAFSGGGDDPVLAGYVRKVQEDSYRITDADFTRLEEAGFSEDAIFELTVAAAMGAAGRRLDAALRALVEEG